MQKIILLAIAVILSNGVFSQNNVGIGTNNPRSTLDISGSLGTNITTLSGATPLTNSNSTVVATPSTSSAYAVTLPALSVSANRIITIIYNGTPSSSGGNYPITITGAGSDGIVVAGAAASNTYSLTEGSIILQNNGGYWFATVVPANAGSNNYIWNQTSVNQTAGYKINGAATVGSLLTGNGGFNETGAANVNTSGSAATNIGNASSTTTVVGPANINTSGSAATSIGNASSTSTVTGPANINTTGSAATNIGNSSSTTTVTGPANINTSGGAATSIGTGTNTVTENGNVSINNSNSTATTNIGTGSTTGAISIGSTTGAQTISVGNGTTVNQTVNIANSGTTGIQTVNIGSTGAAADVTTLNGGTTGGVNINTSNTGTVNIGDGSSGNSTVNVVGLNANSIVINSSGKLSSVADVASGSVLTSSGTSAAPGWTPQSSLSSVPNIYNSDGSLQGLRTVTMGSNNLNFNTTATGGSIIVGTADNVASPQGGVIRSANSNGTNAAGSLFLQGGANSSTGSNGNVYVRGGYGSAEGAVYINDDHGGPTFMNNNGGNVSIGSGTAGAQTVTITNASGVYSNNEAQSSGLAILTGTNASGTQGTSDYILYMGADKTNDLGYIQAVKYGLATTQLGLNARGGNVGVNKYNPAYPLDVAGDINTSVGFTVSGAAASGNYLRGNGNNFVSSSIQPADLSGAIAGNTNYVAKFTGANTIGSGIMYDNGSAIGIGTTSPAGTIGFPNNGDNIAWGPGPVTSLYDNGNIHYWTDDVTNYESGSTGTGAQFNWVAGRTATGSGGSTWMTLTNGTLGIGNTYTASNILDVGAENGQGIDIGNPNDQLNVSGGGSYAIRFYGYRDVVNYAIAAKISAQRTYLCCSGSGTLPWLSQGTDLVFSTNAGLSTAGSAGSPADNSTEKFRITGGGNVGVNNSNPGYKLTVTGGSIGGNYGLTPNYEAWNGYGTGDGGAAIYNDNGSYQKLMIVGNTSAGGSRQVGIWDYLTVNGSENVTGMITVGNVAYNQGSYTYYANGSNGTVSGTFCSCNSNMSFNAGNSSCGSCGVSVYGTGRMEASEFDATSDVRIKKIKDISNSAEDLATLNKLEVTDFNYIDVVQNGPQSKKGFIAQQVEKYFPEAVSQGTDFIPNVFTVPSSFHFDEQSKELTLEMPFVPDLKEGDTLRLLADGAQEDKEVACATGKTVIIKNWKKNPENIFVYGKQVSDFRHVDYDRIHTLGVSAIQELSKQLDNANCEIEQLKSYNAVLENENSTLRSSLNIKADIQYVDQIKAQLDDLKLLMEKNGIRSQR